MEVVVEYRKPELRKIGNEVGLFCATGSSADEGSGGLCQSGSSVSGATSFCQSGGDHGSDCDNGTAPSSGACSLGYSAVGWSICNNGGLVGIACVGGNSPV